MCLSYGHITFGGCGLASLCTMTAVSRLSNSTVRSLQNRSVSDLKGKIINPCYRRAAFQDTVGSW